MQNELQNEEDDDDESSSVQSNSLLSKYDETGIGSPASGEEIREAQSLKEQTTNRRKKSRRRAQKQTWQEIVE